MKISVCGKGGSGKGIMVPLLANEMRDRGYRLLVKGKTTEKVGKLVDFLLSNEKRG